MKNLTIILLFLLAASANASGNDLSARQAERLSEARHILAEVDPRSEEAIARELLTTPYPEENLQIYEAVARTYLDLVTRKEIVDPQAKTQLFNKIRLNVAFLQFGGSPASGTGKKMDVWIRQTLVRHIPAELLGSPALFHSLQ